MPTKHLKLTARRARTEGGRAGERGAWSGGRRGEGTGPGEGSGAEDAFRTTSVHGCKILHGADLNENDN